MTSVKASDAPVVDGGYGVREGPARTGTENAMPCSTTHLRATGVLVAEHEVIWKILDCLEVLAQSGDRFDARTASEILEFLTQFADRCHHGKEEHCLFTALNALGMPSHVGPIAVMMAEHVEGRDAIARMRAEIAGAGAGNADALARFRQQAGRYVTLLRDHIDKENEVLFPMADSMLGDEGQKQVLAAFERVETHDLGAGTHEKYLALADEIVKRLGVKPTSPTGHHGGGCCGHHGH